MSTTTIRLDELEEAALDHLAEIHGGRSNALREGLRLLAALTARREALAHFVSEWAAESGGVSDDAVSRMADNYQL